jgi:hypothetical protein
MPRKTDTEKKYRVEIGPGMVRKAVPWLLARTDLGYTLTSEGVAWFADGGAADEFIDAMGSSPPAPRTRVRH